MNLRRPLTAAVAAAGRGRFVLDGVARMRERPIQDLVDGLSQLGVSAACTLGTGCPPVTVEAAGLPSGTVSSLPMLCWPTTYPLCASRPPAASSSLGTWHPAHCVLPSIGCDVRS